MKRLPKVIYVRLENSSDGTWLEATFTQDGALDGDGPTTVGTYQLVEERKLKKETVPA